MALLLTIGVGATLPSTAAITFGAQSRISFSRSESLVGAGIPRASLYTPSSVSLSPALPLVYCGRGDKKTAKGKRFKHSFGNARPRNKNKGRGPPHADAPTSPPKKDKFDDGEIVKIEIDESLFS